MSFVYLHVDGTYGHAIIDSWRQVWQLTVGLVRHCEDTLSFSRLMEMERRAIGNVPDCVLVYHVVLLIY